MREADIQRAVIDHWRTLALPNTLVAAIPNQNAFGQYGLRRGLFDLLCIGPQIGAGLMELKTEKGKPSQDQLEVLEICQKAGVNAVITYGREEPIRVLEQWSLVRKSNRR